MSEEKKIQSESEIKVNSEHLEDAGAQYEDRHFGEEKEMIQQAKEATNLQHTIPVKENFRLYWKACLWSMMVSTCIVMEGYDIVLLGSLYAQPAFLERYGTLYETGLAIPVKWQNAIGNSTQVGCIIGAVSSGFLVDKFGYRKTLMAALVSCVAFIFIVFFATDLGMLLAGEMLLGIPWGCIATIAPGYACEVLPTTMRGYFAVYVDLAWVMGQLISAGVLQGMSSNTTSLGYKLPFALQWMWPAPLFVGMVFCPESPWWLVKNNKLQEAERSLNRLTIAENYDSTPKKIAEILHTLEVEDEVQRGASYLECFKGPDLRRTEIVMVTYAAQLLSGLSLGGSPTYFLFQAGISTDNAYKFSVGILSLGFVCVLVSSWIMTYVGRRTLYLVGLLGCGGMLYVIGIMSAASNSDGVMLAQGGMLFAWAAFFYTTLGPICYPIIAETSSMRLRAKSISLARNSYYIVSIIFGVLHPYMINKSAWGWGGKTGFFYGGTATCSFIWAWFRLPETKDRTPEELDLLFVHGISHRHFADYDVDPFAEDGEVIKEKAVKRKMFLGFL